MWARLAQIAADIAAAAHRRARVNGTISPELGQVTSDLSLRYPQVIGLGHELMDFRWSEMADVFRLSDLESSLLAIAISSEIDESFALAFGLLRGIRQAQSPSVAVIVELLGLDSLSNSRAALNDSATLRREGLLTIDGAGPFPTRRLAVPDRVVGYVLGDESADPIVAHYQVEAVPVMSASTPVLQAHILADGPLSYVRSTLGTAGVSLAAGAFTQADARYLAVLVGQRADQDAIRAVCREAALTRRGLIAARSAEHESHLSDDDESRAFFSLLAHAVVPVVVVGARPWNPQWLPWLPTVIEAEPLAERERIGMCPLLFGVQRSNPDIRLTDLTLPTRTMDVLAEIVDLDRNHHDLTQTRRMLAKDNAPLGVAALFSGSSGTGKTLAAKAIAGELGVELLTVDTSAVLGSCIGETARNLEKIFQAAEMPRCVLFFDEADALFGGRSPVNDSSDKFPSEHARWLLQRLDSFNGLTVLATNGPANLDRACAMRLNYVVVFDAPTPALRAEVWQRFLADSGDQDADDPVDVARLTRYAEITGGEIRNIMIAAVHASQRNNEPLGMRHLVTATAQEFDKLGRRVPGPLTDRRRPKAAAPNTVTVRDSDSDSDATAAVIEGDDAGLAEA